MIGNLTRGGYVLPMSDRVFSPHLLRVAPVRKVLPAPPHGTPVTHVPITANKAGVGDARPGPAPSLQPTIRFSTSLWCWYAVGSRPLASPQNGDGAWFMHENYFDGRQYVSAWVWYPTTPVSVRGKMVVTGAHAPAGFTATLPGYWVG
jgi:hypothetical protein